MALSARKVKLAIEQVDALDSEAFVAEFGPTVEHSPWVAREAWRCRPFGSAAGLQLAFEAAMCYASQERRLELLRAHPELGEQGAERRELTQASAREQRAERLDRLTGEGLDEFRRLNAEYRARFGYPFIACVGEHSVGSLLAWGQARLDRDPDAEAITALVEVGKIVALRLRGLVADERG